MMEERKEVLRCCCNTVLQFIGLFGLLGFAESIEDYGLRVTGYDLPAYRR